MKVGETKILGEELEVHASAARGSGSFSIQQDGTRLGEGATYAEAEREAKRAIKRRRVDVEVPFKLLDGRRGVARRKHAGRLGAVLVEMDGGEKETIDHRDQRTIVRDDTPDEIVAEYGRLKDEARRSERRTMEIQREYHFDLTSVVDEAVSKVLGERDAKAQAR